MPNISTQSRFSKSSRGTQTAPYKSSKTYSRTAIPKRTAYKSKSKYAQKRKPVDMALKRYHTVLSHPFSESTQPSVVPDKFGGRTVTMKLLHNFSITPNENGEWAAQIFPSVNQFFRTYDVITDGVPNDFNATQAHPQWTSFASSAAFIKPVCLAARVSYTGRQELLSGLTSSMISNETTSTAIPAIVDWGAEQGTHAITVPNRNRPIESVSKLYDAPDFEDAATHDAGTFLNKMSAILLGGSGWPNEDPTVYIETTLYLEIIPKINSVLSFSETPSPTSDNFHTNVENHHTYSSTQMSSGRKSMYYNRIK